MNKGSDGYMTELTAKMLEKGLITSCVICLNFDHHDEHCMLMRENGTRVNQRPPARTIVIGCASWADKLPF
jgi:hypothetical protein